MTHQFYIFLKIRLHLGCLLLCFLQLFLQLLDLKRHTGKLFSISQMTACMSDNIN